MIESIKIKIGETVLELSLEDAKKLKQELDDLMNKTVYYPIYPSWPSYPTYQNPIWTITTGTSDKSNPSY